MNTEYRDRAAALELVLQRHGFIPPSSDELYPELEDALSLIRRSRNAAPVKQHTPTP